MRIIGGVERGRILKMPKLGKVRPTQDRVREAIFNVIKDKVPESSVLDLFAGSGAFGIEALSRGAKSAVFVDNNVHCIKTIKSNLSILGDKVDSSQLIKLDAVRAISRLESENKKFDLVFLDPPYHEDLGRKCLIKIDACDILSKHSFIIVEHFKKGILPDNLISILIVRQKRYGDTVVSFYRKK